jgi:hypothetical protein
VDPQNHFNVDPDPSFHFNADPDPTFYFTADPDPAPYQSDANLLPLVYRPLHPPWLHFKHPRLHCERPWPSRVLYLSSKLLNIYFYADPNTDPAFHSNADLDPGPAS